MHRLLLEKHIYCHSSSDPTILSVANQTGTSDFSFNGDDVWALTQIIDGNIIVIDQIGDIGNDPGSGWSVQEYQMLQKIIPS